MKTYVEKTTWDNNTMIEMTDENGVISWVPCDLSNSDYQAYLNRDKPQVEPLTEIPTE
jgi:hypothetical protein